VPFALTLKSALLLSAVSARFKTSEQHSKWNKVSLGSVEEVFLVPGGGRAWQALPRSVFWLHSKYVSTGFVFTGAFSGAARQRLFGGSFFAVSGSTQPLMIHLRGF